MKYSNSDFNSRSIFKGMIFMSFLLCSVTLYSQKIETLSATTNNSYRGLSIVNDKIIWVSGSNGTVERSLDGGETFEIIKVKGYSNTDFRDIEAFDANTAIIMAISEPAFILRTENGGKDWKSVYQNNSKGMFLDAMDFKGKKGVVIGDPINDHFFMATTKDKGKTWKDVPESKRPIADNGEACFASSGTNIRVINCRKNVFISGGLSSHFYYRNKKIPIPIIKGKVSTGANSVAFMNKKTFVAVGGDFLQKDDTYKNCAITKDGGKTWYFPKNPPSGYRSCVEYINKYTWISCGLNGVDISDDNGEKWRKISNQSFHTVRKAKNGNAVYFSGNNGKIGKLK